MGRLLLVFVPVGAFLGLVGWIAIGAPWLEHAQPRPPPEQPIAFDHRLHAVALGIDCAFCHRAAATGPTAGMPSVEQCMFCHQSIGQGQPEMEKLRTAWIAGDPIDWQRVDRLPDHVRFDHSAHVQAGVACATCHGDVGQMKEVVQVRPLDMADCVDCHRQSDASTDCATCHH
jgi:hypothetical protein